MGGRASRRAAISGSLSRRLAGGEPSTAREWLEIDRCPPASRRLNQRLRTPLPYKGLSMPKKVKVGLIGSQFIPAIHAESFHRCADAELVAVASPTSGNAEKFAAKHHIP